MRILVTGAGGQLGFDVVAEASRFGIEAIATDIFLKVHDLPESGKYVQLDITDQNAVKCIMEQYTPDAVIHCAAWTAVDAAEETGNRRKVFAINSSGTRILAEACKAVDAKMLYISTDYVFDGTGDKPWMPDCDAYAPLNVYGESKLEGELAIRELLERFFIVRVAWVFGKNGHNFVKTMLRLGKTYPVVRVVSDQIGTPTYTLDLARLLVKMIQTEKYGIYHVTNEGGFISWFEFTKEIFRQTGLTAKVLPVTTADYGLSKARRPLNSRLDKSKLTENGFERLPGWQDALTRYLTETGELCNELNQSNEL